jgi:TolB-like protein
MASIVQGYEYDIFISYRHNDNRSGWVTEFVAALKEELAATVKGQISVYFDTNPHDGLFETHDVGKSLEGKLKSLIFIPVISQTYCDPNSFAWKNEFLSFNRMTKEDRYGKDVKLLSGNVAGRILPVKIHNLDKEDTELIENETGGALRCIEFIYAEAGVNRPLRPNDDVKENLNKTQYRNQVNKLANAIKEIVIAITKTDSEKQLMPVENDIIRNPPIFLKPKKNNFKTTLWSLIAAGLLVSAYFFGPALTKSSSAAGRSIAVLPLENMSNDPGLEYFSDGMMQEILNHLFMIGGLKIPSGTSSMRFKGSKLSVRDIARELGVSYILEGNVRTSGNDVRIIVRLINGKNEQLIWTEDYKRTMTATDLFDIQSDVAQKVAENLKVAMDPEVKKRINARPTENTEAYLLYLQATQGNTQYEYAQKLLEKAISLDAGFSDAYATLAFYWFVQGNDLYGKLSREQVLEKAEPLLKKALETDQNSVVVHTYMASIKLWYYWDFETVGKEFQLATQLNPSSSDIYLEFVQYLIIIGKFEEALSLSKNGFNDLDITEVKYVTMALAYFYSGQQEKSLETVDTYLHIFQNDNYILNNSMSIYIRTAKYEKVIELFEKNLINKPINELSNCFLGYLSIAYYKMGKMNQYTSFLKELSSKSKNTNVGSPSYFEAAVYISMDEKEKALQSLHSAYSKHEAEMVWLKTDPLFKSLHGDLRFENMLKEIGFK